jgi:hypothetical protein
MIIITKYFTFSVKDLVFSKMSRVQNEFHLDAVKNVVVQNKLFLVKITLWVRALFWHKAF